MNEYVIGIYFDSLIQHITFLQDPSIAVVDYTVIIFLLLFAPINGIGQFLRYTKVIGSETW